MLRTSLLILLCLCATAVSTAYDVDQCLACVGKGCGYCHRKGTTTQYSSSSCVCSPGDYANGALCNDYMIDNGNYFFSGWQQNNPENQQYRYQYNQNNGNQNYNYNQYQNNNDDQNQEGNSNDGQNQGGNNNGGQNQEGNNNAWQNQNWSQQYQEEMEKEYEARQRWHPSERGYKVRKTHTKMGCRILKATEFSKATKIVFWSLVSVGIVGILASMLSYCYKFRENRRQVQRSKERARALLVAETCAGVAI